MPVNRPLVIDIYQGDDVRDPMATNGFQQAKAAGIVGCIHKATEGLGVIDRRYAARRTAWMSGKLDVALEDGSTVKIDPLWGAYCFFHGQEPVAEADRFLAVAQPDHMTLLAIDWENVGASGYAPSASAARAFLERIAERTGRMAVVYSGNVAKEQIRGKDAFFAAHRLWLASYGAKWTTQASWSYPWLWQDDGDQFGPGPHTIPGIQRFCDNSTIVAPMTVKRLIAEWSGAPPAVA
jgi:lysozyme